MELPESGNINDLARYRIETAKSDINREKFDYTKWQRHLFEDMTLEELNEAAAAFSKNNPL